MFNRTSTLRGPTDQEIRHVARTTVKIMEDRGLDCCFFGSFACSLYGTTRTPNDIDLIVVNDFYTQEEIKELLVAADRRFYTRPSRNPGATYRVLYFRLQGYRRSCKVDILLPGIINIPPISSSDIVHVDRNGDYPLAPLSVLLLLKLQGWSDHNEAHRADLVQKQYVDASDLQELLKICEREGLRIDQEEEDGTIPWEFKDLSDGRVVRYVSDYPSSRRYWRAVGFEI